MFQNRSAALGTMHGKEQVIAPLFQQEYQMAVIVPPGLNTDVWGTFTRDVERKGSPIESAKAKALKAMELTGLSLGIASEGSFSPYPIFPMLPMNEEIVLLIDLVNGLEIMGRALSYETNFNQRAVCNIEEAIIFAEQIGFPDHGLILSYFQAGEPKFIKGIRAEASLLAAIESAQTFTECFSLETDMRACHNPMRMKVIESATQNLLSNLKAECPLCHVPGFTLIGHHPGLPCAMCGFPTARPLSQVKKCSHCAYQGVEPIAESSETADPVECLVCNP